MFYLVPFRHCCCILKEQALARIISGAVTEDYLEEQVEEHISSKLLRTERKEGNATGPGCRSIKSIEHSCEQLSGTRSWDLVDVLEGCFSPSAD